MFLDIPVNPILFEDRIYFFTPTLTSSGYAPRFNLRGASDFRSVVGVFGGIITEQKNQVCFENIDNMPLIYDSTDGAKAFFSLLLILDNHVIEGIKCMFFTGRDYFWLLGGNKNSVEFPIFFLTFENLNGQSF